MVKDDLIKELGELGMATRFKRLGDRLSQEVARIYKSQNLDFEPKWFTTMYALYKNDSMSIQALAQSLGFTHPAIIQFVNQMKKKNLVEARQGEEDKRMNLISLTQKGRETFEAIRPLLTDIEEATSEVVNSPGIDMLLLLDRIEAALDEKGTYDRIMERIKERELKEVRIVSYEPKYKGDFKTLNEEWLKKYFSIEPEDERILSSPEEILKNGGEIFFALYNNEVAGTCAAIKTDKRTFELAKMGVTEKYQGRQIGKKLALTVIGFAVARNAKTVFLETSSKLTSALNLYKKLGFEQVPNDHPEKYSRCTIKMKLDL
jgi:DNA-binding MarR family transcriptional regulator/N-acetylglutamate synthase-like GNAT family acetyltransferase